MTSSSRFEKHLERRQHMQPREGHRSADPQPARQARRRFVHGLLRMIRFLDRAKRMFVEPLARIRRRQAARRTQQQARAQMLFKLRDGFGHRGLPQFQASRRGRERSRLDYRDERFHCCHPVHAIPCSFCYVATRSVSGRSGWR
jgi:hypothetical protein